MSGVQTKPRGLPRLTPAHFSEVAAQSWVLGYMESVKVGQRVSGNILLGLVHRRWRRHNACDLATELLLAISALESQQIFKVIGDRSQVAAIDLEKIR